MGVISTLAQVLDKKAIYIERFLVYAPRKYRVYKIPKRKHGFRVIAQPTAELKKLQRAFIDRAKIPVHECAMAYRDGVSIKDNAQLHSGNTFFLSMDFENFFNSITPDLLWGVFNRFGKVISPNEKLWLSKLLFWCPSKKNSNKLILSVGAPSSPKVSNFCMYFFDEYISIYCQDRNITYSRYADDLSFSTNEKDILFQIPAVVQETLLKLFGREITINNSKTVFSSKAHNRHVTGITITNEGELSLGREKKRYIKHLIFQFKNGLLGVSDVGYLRGVLSFAFYIEPAFKTSMKKKYTQATIDSIFNGVDDDK
ncbi:retron St85 family RNA-directed DNA polymerase [Aeromonas salmonicida]|uniref:retron St85 family RNA-directed DNA polymerase n=1 Tax=Aeromonas salmonicida TaxID=645 RepID=UPI00232B0166|nr:retron St85 family RNA-directed DNA polymerase [Aeromonas salmonicida]WCH25939.1 retron St85 family RNA-directed DNA polymerase [Aeromonas salmonicida]